MPRSHQRAVKIAKMLITFFSELSQARAQDADFAPQVTATCKAGSMNIKVLFNSQYSGAVHARDHRTPACMSFGNGSNIVTMSLNLLVKQGSSEYCGILVSNVSSDVRSTNSLINFINCLARSAVSFCRNQSEKHRIILKNFL